MYQGFNLDSDFTVHYNLPNTCESLHFTGDKTLLNDHVLQLSDFYCISPVCWLPANLSCVLFLPTYGAVHKPFVPSATVSASL